MQQITRFVIALVSFFAFLMSTQTTYAAQQTQQPGISLGEWKFHLGDNLDWAKPDFDDSEWTSVSVPGSQHFNGLMGGNAYGWYRVKVHVGWEYRGKPLGLKLGRITSAEQFYLNGVLIGGEGRVDGTHVGVVDKVRVYPLPRDLLWYTFLDYNRENVIAIRILNPYLPSGGIQSGRIEFGDYGNLVLKAREMDTIVKIGQGISIGVLVIIGIFCVFLYLNGFREKTNVFFGTFISLAAVANFLDSLIFYDLGWKIPTAEGAGLGLDGLVAVLYGQIIIAAFSGQLTRLERGYALFAIALALLLVFGIDYQLGHAIFWVSSIFQLVVYCTVVTRCYAAFRRKLPDALILLAVTLVPISAIFAINLGFLMPPGIEAINTSIFVLALVLLFTIARRYQRQNSRMHDLSRRVVEIQEIERHRLARELHDGLGQTLAAIKLNLQMLNERLNKFELGQAVTNVSSAASSLRDLVGILRPLDLEGANLSEAIRRHAEHVSMSTGRSVVISELYTFDPPSHLSVEIFRIYQEALNNSVVHSKSSKIIVSLVRSADSALLTVQDDGQGFNDTPRKSNGLGMLSMHERADILGATISVESTQGIGTTVKLKVPLHD